MTLKMAVPMTMMTMMMMMMVACGPLEVVGSLGWMELLHKALVVDDDDDDDDDGSM